ncbi:pyridoxamine 5'-phosphate oxidase family protein [Ectobacillus funiculus]|uniref:pyridoxamine 5'-phosphate oxidase family protein n=1 Tax=Ectobacillus funiculus TaxID=137993 RepID=UPI00397A6F1D
MELKGKILNILQNQQTGVLATVRDHKPHICFMMFFHQDLTLYVATDHLSRKVDDIKENNNVHVLIGNEGKIWGEEFIEIEADAYLEDSAQLKQEFWNDSLNKWLDGPEDPNYILLRLEPKHIYYIDKAGAAHPEVLTL